MRTGVGYSVAKCGYPSKHDVREDPQGIAWSRHASSQIKVTAHRVIGREWYLAEARSLVPPATSSSSRPSVRQKPASPPHTCPSLDHHTTPNVSTCVHSAHFPPPPEPHHSSAFVRPSVSSKISLDSPHQVPMTTMATTAGSRPESHAGPPVGGKGRDIPELRVSQHPTNIILI